MQPDVLSPMACLARTWTAAGWACVPPVGAPLLAVCPPGWVHPPRRSPRSQGPRLTVRQAIQLRAPAACGLGTPGRGLLQKPKPGQSCRLWSRRGPWGRPGVGTLRKVPETTRKVVEASQSQPVPTPDPDPGSGGPTDPAPSWPAQRLPLCVGLPPSILGARPGEGDGLSGTSSPTASSESFCARAPHVPRGDSNVHQDGKSPCSGESRAGTGSGGPGPALGLHTARLGGRGPQGARPPRRTDRQGCAPWGPSVHRARPR